MRVKRIIDDNIILNSPIKPFTQFNTAIQTKIIVNLVITGTSLYPILYHNANDYGG